MIQEILVYIILTVTMGDTFYSIYRVFNPKYKSSGGCAGCSSAGCSVKELKKYHKS
ncbi:MAG TPA: hypothetical protein PKW61_05915 [Tenuifilaceae bacterium]|nr:hypothetical protein [Tenuifilaceae bacterium]